MDPARVSLGERVAAGSAVALLVVMWLVNWFTVENDLTGLGGRSAWEAFAGVDLVLFLVAIGAVGIAAASAAAINLRALRAPPALLVACGGLLACALVLFRLIVVPELQIEYPSSTGTVREVGSTSREVGGFLGLAASAGIAVGGFLALRDEGRRVR